MKTNSITTNGTAPTLAAITGQSVAHRTRQLIATRDWTWLHAQVSDDAATVRATAILRRDYRLAQDWLMQTRPVTGLPLGNGINDQWQLVAHVTPDGRLGVVDVAAGTATTYSVRVPHCVDRFASPVTRAQTHNEAGGSGGTPSGWRQIAVILTGVARTGIHCGPVRPVSMIYGLSTCYGTVGEDIRGTWRMREVDPTMTFSATADPQREEIKMGMGVEKAVWLEYAKSKLQAAVRAATPGKWIDCGRAVTISGGHYGAGDDRLQYVYFFGSAEERAACIPAIRESFRAFALRREVRTMIRALGRNSFRVHLAGGNDTLARQQEDAITEAVAKILRENEAA